MKKLLCILLVLLVLPTWVISCTKDPSGNGPSTDGTETTVSPSELDSPDRTVLVRDGAAIYKVVRPDRVNKVEAAAAGEIMEAVKEKCGVELGVGLDDAAATEYEILIGNTNRPESVAAMANVTDSTFSVSASGNKIVIAANNDTMLMCAIDYFVDNYVAPVPSVEGLFSVEKVASHTSSSDFIVFDRPADGNYLVTYPQSEKDYLVLASTDKDTVLNNLEYLTSNIYHTLRDSKNAGVVMSTDGAAGFKEEWKEILVGWTTREATKKVKAELAFDEYAIKVVGNDIVLTGLGFVTTKAAVEKFLEVIELFRDPASETPLYRIPADFCYKDTVSLYSKWPKAPEYTGGVLDSVTDGGDDSYVAVYTNTNKDEYNAYLTSLEGKGYTKYFENDMNGNLYAIYKTDAIVINAYFIPHSSSVYIVAENGYKVTLPALESENVYTDRGLQSSITQMKLNNVTNSNGQCHVFKLSDGRFIVVDGGMNETYRGKSDADNLLELLKSMSGGEKPVIAAWFITHIHNDHYNVLLQFGSDFKNDVTVESFIYNFPPDEMANGSTAKVETDIEKAMKAFKGAKLIKAHTGQKYYIANAEIEMIFAPELICPNYITFVNDSSTVFSVNIGGTKTLITADASPNTSKIMCAMYGDYLKCDILQISHHGSYGCSVEYYEYTSPTKLAFLPVGITQKIRLTAEKENVFIKGLVPIVSHYEGTYTYDLPAKN